MRFLGGSGEAGQRTVLMGAQRRGSRWRAGKKAVPRVREPASSWTPSPCIFLLCHSAALVTTNWVTLSRPPSQHCGGRACISPSSLPCPQLIALGMDHIEYFCSPWGGLLSQKARGPGKCLYQGPWGERWEEPELVAPGKRAGTWAYSQDTFPSQRLAQPEQHDAR